MVAVGQPTCSEHAQPLDAEGGRLEVAILLMSDPGGTMLERKRPGPHFVKKMSSVQVSWRTIENPWHSMRSA
jgi:hypothetical protein